jgi:hypothetical protein
MISVGPYVKSILDKISTPEENGGDKTLNFHGFKSLSSKILGRQIKCQV